MPVECLYELTGSCQMASNVARLFGSIDKLNLAAVSALSDPNTRQKLEAQGFEIPPRERQTPEALAALQKADIDKWWPIIKAAGIRAQ